MVLVGIIPYSTRWVYDVLCGAPGLFPYWFRTLLIWNISRSPLWSSWFISLLISCTCNMEYKQKPSVELLVYFLTDFIHFCWGIWTEVLCGAPGLFPYWFHTLLIRNMSRSPLWSSWSSSLLISYTSNMEYKQKSSVELLVYFLTVFIHFEWEI